MGQTEFDGERGIGVHGKHVAGIVVDQGGARRRDSRGYRQIIRRDVYENRVMCFRIVSAVHYEFD